MRRCFGYALGITRGAHATTLAGVGDQEIVLTLVAVSTCKTMRENSAFEVSAKGAIDMGRRCFTILSAGEFQPGIEVDMVNAIHKCVFGTVALVALGCRRGALSGGGHRIGPSWSDNRDRILYTQHSGAGAQPQRGGQVNVAFGGRSTTTEAVV